MTRFPVIALRSVDLDTTDLKRSEKFYAGVWGLEVVARMPDRVYLRATGSDHHVLVLHGAGRVALKSVTFRCDEAADLEAISYAAQAYGCEILQYPAPTDEPGGGTMLVLREPQGGVLRFVYGDLKHAAAGPVADRALRLAHVNLNSVDPDAETAFYARVLGFRLADRSKAMAFVRCNADHHAVVIAQAPVNGLNHIAFLVPDWESVMRASGRMVDHGFPIAWGIGRHGPGDNVFAYFVDPLGVVIEYTAEVLQVDDAYVVRGPDQWGWPPGRTDQWGIAPPKTEFVKAAQIAVLHARPHGGAS
jgi:catechol 2,3-dioxygenase-like lactoylglutathione lyase family enzyme